MSPPSGRRSARHAIRSLRDTGRLHRQVVEQPRLTAVLAVVGPPQERRGGDREVADPLDRRSIMLDQVAVGAVAPSEARSPLGIMRIDSLNRPEMAPGRVRAI